MRARMVFAGKKIPEGKEAEGVVRLLAQKIGIRLTYDHTTKGTHFPRAYASYEDAVSDFQRVEKELPSVWGHAFKFEVREEGAKDFCDERAYAAVLERRLKLVGKSLAPLAELSKILHKILQSEK